jgi:predicted Rossmann fold flavoprotein
LVVFVKINECCSVFVNVVIKPMRLIVIGGGAAGFFGAIAAAKANPQAQVTLLEAGRDLLAKVRISGGGRCNVTHACFEPGLLVQHYPRGGKALWGPFSRFQPRDTVDWFAAAGVQLKIEADGRMFPITDDSATVVDCLVDTARRLRIKIMTGAAVVKVDAGLDKDSIPSFTVHCRAGEIWQGDRLLLATGSSPQGWRIAAELGHQIHPPVPSLFTFNLDDSRLQDLAGLSVDPVHLRLLVPEQKPLEQSGPLLITHWGLSGPAVLKLSAWGARMLHANRYRAQLVINWLPKAQRESLRQQLLAVKSQLPRRAIASNCPVLLPQRLWQRFCAIAGIDDQKRWADLSTAMLNTLLQELLQGTYIIQGKGVFKEEFVTCGGVDLKQVNFKTMESRCCPGLYFAGEVLDIDGVTGGFNFQSAWTTSWLAAQAITL